MAARRVRRTYANFLHPGMKGRETQKSPDKQEDRVPRADNRGARIWPRVPGYQWGVGTVPWALHSYSTAYTTVL